jgi:hypothetical protein
VDTMIRRCDGTDPNLLDDTPAHPAPCACGLTFDDTTRSTVYPHVFLPTAADRQRFAEWLDTVSVDDIATMNPDAFARMSVMGRAA